VARLLAPPDTRDKIHKTQSNEELWSVIYDSGIEVDYEITAKDIMRPYVAFVSPENTFHEAARELHRHHLDSMPIIDTEKVFYGAISCYDLFSFGLPDFFNNLHVISFVKHMNPFEKYFDVDDTLKLHDLIKDKPKSELIISANATLMEIIFEMTVKNKEFLYVLSDDGKLRGVIDRYSIIDKIIMVR
jgi:CBS domain-containing protein